MSQINFESNFPGKHGRKQTAGEGLTRGHLPEAPTVVITGGNSGIGFETARVLARKGWRIIITGRDAAKLAAAAEAIKTECGAPVKWRFGDFASLASVRNLAAELDNEPRIDALLNNAGIAMSTRRVTGDGNEMTLQVNHLAPFLLTNLLLDKLKASAPARIVNIASSLHSAATSAGFEDFQFERSYSLREAYARTKLYNILFARALARHLDGSGVTANALHPGVIRTNLGGDGDISGLLRLTLPFLRVMFARVEAGARVPVFVATAPELANVSGRYFSTRLAESVPSQLAQDDRAARELWHRSRDLVGAG